MGCEFTDEDSVESWEGAVVFAVTVAIASWLLSGLAGWVCCEVDGGLMTTEGCTAPLLP